MHNLHLRNIDDCLMVSLKQKAAEMSMSMNKFILSQLKKLIEPATRQVKIHHEFDKFAGSWTSDDVNTFEKNIESFSKIDDDLWK